MGKVMTEREIEVVLREITDEEAAFYRKYGCIPILRRISEVLVRSGT